MIGSPQIAALPRGSFLINTARGALLDTTAIPPAIRSGQLLKDIRIKAARACLKALVGEPLRNVAN